MKQLAKAHTLKYPNFKVQARKFYTEHRHLTLLFPTAISTLNEEDRIHFIKKHAEQMRAVLKEDIHNFHQYISTCDAISRNAVL